MGKKQKLQRLSTSTASTFPPQCGQEPGACCLPNSLSPLAAPSSSLSRAAINHHHFWPKNKPPSLDLGLRIRRSAIESVKDSVGGLIGPTAGPG
ncbi:hypothetical protein CCACVL1_07270 [Corchorus capsularis]|uniref:Uncharacterized protein n=1 Tax=Corchorus capsularis TaxID=210143 RepID=A0A1R3J7M0_COCAP|nr:hypothetical protein CCACVL1_07270 [Corchorus capsularis]